MVVVGVMEPNSFYVKKQANLPVLSLIHYPGPISNSMSSILGKCFLLNMIVAMLFQPMDHILSVTTGQYPPHFLSHPVGFTPSLLADSMYIRVQHYSKETTLYMNVAIMHACRHIIDLICQPFTKSPEKYLEELTIQNW